MFWFSPFKCFYIFINFHTIGVSPSIKIICIRCSNCHNLKRNLFQALSWDFFLTWPHLPLTASLLFGTRFFLIYTFSPRSGMSCSSNNIWFLLVENGRRKWHLVTEGVIVDGVILLLDFKWAWLKYVYVKNSYIQHYLNITVFYIFYNISFFFFLLHW